MTDTLVDRIRNNDGELKELRLTEEPPAYCAKVSDLTDAFQSNSNIEYIRFDRDFLPALEPSECDGFFKSIGGISSLKEAQIWHASLSVKVLSTFIAAARNLESLQLGFLHLEGTQEDFIEVADALKEHPSLRAFCMLDFSLNDNSVSMDGLIEVLSTLPKLEMVKLEVTHSRRSSLVGVAMAVKPVQVVLSGNALAHIFKSKSLQVMHLGRLVLQTNDYSVLADAIQSAPALKSLSLSKCGLDDSSCAIITKAIGKNKTLERVDLSCNSISDEGCKWIASGLQDNHTIKFLRLWGNSQITSAGFDTISNMLGSGVLERVPLMTPFKMDPSFVVGATLA